MRGCTRLPGMWKYHEALFRVNRSPWGKIPTVQRATKRSLYRMRQHFFITERYMQPGIASCTCWVVIS